MYLKRVEIQGFKSFAGRTVFEFGPGVTAVVGPNGSGKSNLADALRWVLGEQNPRVLRSRKSEEVIFAGGHGRAPAGFAEVSIALDNGDGWLPIGFEEVVFTRRLHRSGESEYLVNRARVRLRDALDLFWRARVGQNSYAIMGQGLVDSVLNLQPLDRRALIEEAADVRRHRLKIQDAVERLAATRDNLDRVDLLVGEIAPRLHQLEAQARRAAEYNGLTGELAETLHGWYALQWRERGDALAAARGLYEQRMRELVRAQTEVGQIETELDSLRTELQQQREAAAAGESALRDLDDHLRGGEQRLQLLEERRRLLTARSTEIGDDLHSLAREHEELAGSLDEELALAGDEATYDAAVAERQAELETAEASLEEARQALVEADESLRSARSAAAALEDRAGRAQRGLRQLEREQEDAVGRRNAVLARLRKHGGDALRLLKEQQRLEHDLQVLANEQATARRQVQVSRELAERSERQLAATARQLDEGRARMELLARLRDEHQNSDGATRVIVEQTRRLGADTPPRLLAVLSQVIRVQNGLETAIEAALGEQLGALIVPETLDAQAVLRMLDESAAGRATIVPLAELKPVHAVNLNGERGILGVAARFIKCDARYRELVDTLLGRVIVVEDLRTAQATLRRGLGTAVTLDGVVVRPTGIITGGRGGAAGLMLQYERELEELPERIAALRAEQAAAQQEATRARDHLRAVEVRLREADNGVEALHALKRRLQDDGGALRDALAGLRAEAARLRDGSTTFSERRATLDKELALAEEERRRCSLAVRSAQLAVEAARREVESLRAPVEALRGRLATAIGARQALEQQRTALTRLIEGRRAAQIRTERAITAREAELAARGAEIEQLGLQRDELQAELATTRAAMAERRAVLQPLREQVTALSRRERELFELLAQRRNELLGLERASMEAESSVNRRAQAIDRLREEMDADGVELPQELVAPQSEPAEQTAQALNSDSFYRASVAGAGSRLQVDAGKLQARVRSLRGRIRSLGPVNAEAQADYEEARERHDFLTSQVQDLQRAEAALQEALEELRRVVRERFRQTLHAVNEDFGRYFKTFFGGGTARLALTEPEDYGESGVDILAQPPGKRQQHLQLLSGGERSMTAVALLFALLEHNPAPFSVLDEVDAALDEANIDRFGAALGELAQRTQFILITHNRATIQAAGTIYGISMGGDSVSTVLSLRLEDLPAGA